MPNLTKEQIESWIERYNGESWQRSEAIEEMPKMVSDIAQTALDALQRVEELEKELEKLERQSNRAIKDEGDSAFIAVMRRAKEINVTYERGEM